MNTLQLDERLNRIEKLLVASKRVLTFEEACEYSDYAASYMYKLTSAKIIPHSKPNGKAIFFDKDKLEAWLLQNPQKSIDEIEQEALNYSLKNRR